MASARRSIARGVTWRTARQQVLPRSGKRGPPESFGPHLGERTDRFSRAPSASLAPTMPEPRSKSPNALDRVEAQIRSGALRRCSWELLRLQLFPGLKIDAATRKLCTWAKKKRIAVTFESQTVYAGSTRLEVIYVIFQEMQAVP